MTERIINYIAMFLALIIVLPLHEFAHAFVAVKNGDMTPKLYGRYTLNPLAHFDPIGLAFFVFAGFGWAKPVPINPYNFRDLRKGLFFTSAAGVVANYILAFVAYPLSIIASLYLPSIGYFKIVIVLSLSYMVSLSLCFFVFNLIPVYPLDGFRIVDVFYKRRGDFYNFLRYKGIYVLYCLFFLSVVADFTGVWQLDVLGIIIQNIVDVISEPIIWFWGLII